MKKEVGDKQIVPADYVDRLHSEWVHTTSKNDAETRGGYFYVAMFRKKSGTIFVKYIIGI